MTTSTFRELQGFTLDSYIKLLKYLKNNYKITPFRDVRYKDTPYLILRHDIDISPQDALTMARIENDLNVRSTYFVLLSSPFYNIFRGDNVAIFRTISDLGHEVGLHYHPHQYRLFRQEYMKTLQIEKQVVESFLGKKVSSIARHGLWDRDPFVSTRRYINANNPYFRANLFVHDSERAWVTLEGLHTLLNNPPARVQLLIHPENWQDYETDRKQLLERQLKNLETEIQEMKKRIFEVYRTDQQLIDYDNSINKANFSQNPFGNDLKNQSDCSRLSLMRYYLVNTKIGWNLHNLKGKIGNKLIGRKNQ